MVHAILLYAICASSEQMSKKRMQQKVLLVMDYTFIVWDNVWDDNTIEIMFGHCQVHKLTNQKSQKNPDYSLLPEGAKRVGKTINSAGSLADGQLLTDMVAHTTPKDFSKRLCK